MPSGQGIRGSAIQASVDSSFTVPWPLAQSGDLVVIFGSTAYNATAPVGWDIEFQDTGTVWDALAISKVLDNTDISNGSVTIPTGGTFDGVFAIVTFVGNPGAIRETVGQSAGTNNPYALSTSNTLTDTDYVLYYSSMRSADSPRTITTTIGTSLQFVDDGITAFGNLAASSSISGGVIAQSWLFGAEFGIPDGYEDMIILVVENAGTPPPPAVDWVPNGLGAGTDNRIAGGLGGYTAIPQPSDPTQTVPSPENTGQFEPLNYTYLSPTDGKLNFTITNPGSR